MYWECEMNYFIDRIKEPSTWRGFVLILTALGLATEDQSNAILNFGLAASGLVATFLPDKL